MNFCETFSFSQVVLGGKTLPETVPFDEVPVWFTAGWIAASLADTMITSAWMMGWVHNQI